jgi:hypothetical protein
MTARILTSVISGVILFTPVAAQTKSTVSKWTAPLTPDAQPDLQGVWFNQWATPLERPKELADRPFLTEQEVTEFRKRAQRLFKDQGGAFAGGDRFFQAILENPEKYEYFSVSNNAWMDDRDFDNRTSLVADPPDGRIPPLTPAGQQRFDAWRTAFLALRAPDGPENLTNFDRCITGGVPIFSSSQAEIGQVSYQQIFQSSQYIVILMEAIHDARIIPLDGRPHLPPNVRTWNGDSLGRWEGQTLVVDTTNFSPKSHFMGSSENLHLVERFTRVAPDEIEYVITVDDPTTWTKPWTIKARLMQTQDKIYEYACHEGNQAMEDILAGTRAQEKAAQENAKKSSK